MVRFTARSMKAIASLLVLVRRITEQQGEPAAPRLKPIRPPALGEGVGVRPFPVQRGATKPCVWGLVAEQKDTLKGEIEAAARIDRVEDAMCFRVAGDGDLLAAALMAVAQHDAEGEIANSNQQRGSD